MLRGCGAVSRWVRRIPTGTEGAEAGGFAAVRIEGFIGEIVRLERVGALVAPGGAWVVVDRAGSGEGGRGCGWGG